MEVSLKTQILEHFRTHEIEHDFFFAQAPPQNEVVERKNQTLQEMDITMLHEHETSHGFWEKAINIAYYILNRVLIRPILLRSPYDL